jgi:hypothetical protein
MSRDHKHASHRTVPNATRVGESQSGQCVGSCVKCRTKATSQRATNLRPKPHRAASDAVERVGLLRGCDGFVEGCD